MSLTSGAFPAVPAQGPAGPAAAEWDLLTDAVHWSPEAFRLLARDPRLGPLTLDQLPAHLLTQDRPAMHRMVTEALVHGQAGAGVVRVRHADGGVGSVRCAGEPVLDEDGHVTALRMLLRTL